MIPKIIHQTWKTSNIPNKWKEYHNTWKKHFPEPEYQHILWTDEVNKDFIKENYNWFYNTFSGYPKGIQRADAIRYFILFHYGGIYADLDCEVRENFYQDLEQDNINLAGNPYENGKSTMNNLMCSDKNNDKWKKVFQELEKSKNLKEKNINHNSDLNIFTDFNPMDLLPFDKSFFTYNSLKTFTCQRIASRKEEKN